MVIDEGIAAGRCRLDTHAAGAFADDKIFPRSADYIRLIRTRESGDAHHRRRANPDAVEVAFRLHDAGGTDLLIGIPEVAAAAVLDLAEGVDGPALVNARSARNRRGLTIMVVVRLG